MLDRYQQKIDELREKIFQLPKEVKYDPNSIIQNNPFSLQLQRTAIYARFWLLTDKKANRAPIVNKMNKILTDDIKIEDLGMTHDALKHYYREDLIHPPRKFRIPKQGELEPYYEKYLQISSDD